MNRKHVYRKGDIVRVINPRCVVRVGYPKTVEDYLDFDAVELNIAENLMRGLTLAQAIRDAELKKMWGQKFFVSHKVAWLAAYLKARADGFGGRARSIHFEEMTYWPGMYWGQDTKEFTPFETRVLSKRVVKTGKYFPPSGDLDDYYPGGLEEMKTHVIISTEHGEFHSDDIEPVKEKNEQTS